MFRNRNVEPKETGMRGEKKDKGRRNMRRLAQKKGK
jgi:hypothetical protein